MAEGWDKVPNDVLSMIVDHFERSDYSRFRSVCSSWSSITRPLDFVMDPPPRLIPPPYAYSVYPLGIIRSKASSPTPSSSSSNSSDDPIHVEQGWDRLPADIFGMIAEFLPPIDQARFRSICTSWSSAPLPPYQMKTPWLLLPPIAPNQPLRIHSLASDETIELSHIDISDCRAVLNYNDPDWLIYLDRSAEMQIVNLESGERIRPPSITSLPEFIGVRTNLQGHVIAYVLRGQYPDPDFYRVLPCEMVFSYYHKAFLIHHNDQYTVFFINGTSGCLAYAKQGDAQWTECNPICNKISDLLFHNGFLYMSTNDGSRAFRIQFPHDLADLRRFYLQSVNLGQLHSWNSLSRHYTPTTYLLQQASKFFMVVRYLQVERSRTDTQVFHRPLTNSVTIFESNQDLTTWQQRKNIGESPIFLGKNTPFLLAQVPPQFNKYSIYFTDDYPLSTVAPDYADMGVYNLIDRTYTRYYDPPLSAQVLPRANWLMPSNELSELIKTKEIGRCDNLS